MALRRWGILVAFVFGFLGSNVRADYTFPSVTIAGSTYSNVTVMNKNRTHVFISHAKGMASFRVEELSRSMQKDLGYVVEPEEKPRPSLTTLPTALNEVDPKYRAMQEELADQFANWLKTVDRQ